MKNEKEPNSKTLNPLRISETLLKKMKLANAKLNDMNITEIPFQEFRRLCYEFFSILVIKEKPDQIRNLLQK